MPAPTPPSRLALRPSSDAPSHARRHTRALLRAWGADDDLAEAAELVVSEFVTNSVQHAARPVRAGENGPLADGVNVGSRAEEIVLALRQADGVLRIEVSDWDVTPPRFGDAGAGDGADPGEGGRGLVIVAALAKQWGCVRPDEGGKTVWCELPDA